MSGKRGPSWSSLGPTSGCRSLKLRWSSTIAMAPGSICWHRLAAPAVTTRVSQPSAFSTRTGSASSLAVRPSYAASGASATATGTPSSRPMSSGACSFAPGRSSPCRTTFSLSWLAIEAWPEPSSMASRGRSGVRSCTKLAISRMRCRCGCAGMRAFSRTQLTRWATPSDGVGAATVCSCGRPARSSTRSMRRTRSCMESDSTGM